ncbi:cyanobactin biosynthesis PatC/TenC/TruC family protein [Lyngbya sp. CCAP 1446/10]|uniref:LamG-like jellyroll fold domain-containing protein n=1 Tax=Lyngbya sp. CCAP 1446/10 TaxID=439293 RepID=UPI002237D66F|nr:LamG-like jellyroll fold domain-containing protein [Lyngbya sp. CCAP 1446/10]MCW6049895.1 cyanobactin biosynthesis PatC/TenC/TruC family protein [Lyngbya sp. CCAP 1446/10]
MTNLLKNSRPVLTFDGVDSYVAIPHISCELGNNFTVEAWVKTKTNKGVQRVFSEHPAWGFGLFNNQLRFTVYKRKNYNTTSAKFVAGTWFHLALVFEANSKLHFYVNGELVQTLDGKRRKKSSSISWFIGTKNPQGAECWKGQLSEIRIWNKCRSQAELQADMSRCLAGNEPGLAGYWPFNEGTANTVCDKTQNANHGTIHGATWELSEVPVLAEVIETQEIVTMTDTNAVQERLQTVLNFDGIDDKIDIDYAKEINPTTFTVEVWVMFIGGDGYRSVLTSRDGSDVNGCKGYLFYATPAGKWEFWLGSGEVGASWTVLSGPNVEINVWVHLTGVYDGKSDTAHFYVNGQEVSKQENVKFKANTKRPLRIGAGNTEQPGYGDYLFNGKISEVRLWNKVRTAKEIQSKLVHRLKGNEAGLVGYWSLSEGSGTLAREKAKKPQNGKIYGDAVWGQSIMPIIDAPDAKERLLNSTGLEDYGYWWKKLSEAQADRPKVPFRRGRIWS